MEKLKENKSKGYVWKGGLIGFVFGLIIVIISYLKLSFIENSSFLLKILKLFYLPSLYFIDLTSGWDQGLASLLLILPALLLPIVLCGLLGLLIGWIINIIKNKKMGIKRKKTKFKFPKNPFILGFIMAFLLVLITSFSSSSFGFDFTISLSFFIIPGTLLAALAIVIYRFIRKKNFFNKLGHFQITFVYFILVLILIIDILYNGSFAWGSFGKPIYFLLKCLGVGIIGDGLFYLIKKKKENFALALKSIFISVVIFLILLISFKVIISLIKCIF